MEELRPTDKTGNASEKKKEEKETQSIGRFLGVELSAPKNMKNPLAIFLALVIGNFILLFLIGKALF